jgi:hypothetical protein
MAIVSKIVTIGNVAARIRHGRSIEIFVRQGDTGDTGVG